MGYVPPGHTVQVPPSPPPPSLPPSPPTATATTARDPRGRNKQASDSGTSSCSPTRNWCASEALGAFKKKKKRKRVSARQPVRLSDTRIFLIAAKQPLLFRTVRCPCLWKLKLWESGALFSFQDVLETSTKLFNSFSIKASFSFQSSAGTVDASYWSTFSWSTEQSANHWCNLQSNQASKHEEQTSVAPSKLQYHHPDHTAQSVIEIWL